MEGLHNGDNRRGRRFDRPNPDIPPEIPPPGPDPGPPPDPTEINEGDGKTH